MHLTINGEEIDFNGNTVRQLLEQLQIADRPVAVERNGQIVSYSTFDQTVLNDGDVLEVVTLVGGGGANGFPPLWHLIHLLNIGGCTVRIR